MGLKRFSLLLTLETPGSVELSFSLQLAAALGFKANGLSQGMITGAFVSHIASKTHLES